MAGPASRIPRRNLPKHTATGFFTKHSIIRSKCRHINRTRRQRTPGSIRPTEWLYNDGPLENPRIKSSADADAGASGLFQHDPRGFGEGHIAANDRSGGPPAPRRGCRPDSPFRRTPSRGCVHERKSPPLRPLQFPPNPSGDVGVIPAEPHLAVTGISPLHHAFDQGGGSHARSSALPPPTRQTFRTGKRMLTSIICAGASTSAASAFLRRCQS